MRAKRPYIVLSFHTTLEAMEWEKHCLASCIPGRLIPLPREISAGCGLAWRAELSDRECLIAFMKEHDIRWEAMYEIEMR